MDDTQRRYSLDLDPAFERFVLSKIKSEHKTPAKSPCDSRNLHVKDTTHKLLSPKIDITNYDVHSPHTPQEEQQFKQQRSTMILSSCRSAKCEEKYTPNIDPTKLHPFAVGDGGNFRTPSPRTPLGLPNIWKPLPSYRLRRLRHHLHAHKPPQF
uniref:Uncharacterized protein n=1 Tax=Musca domestica TaxID=7370 RepID=A0A1I8NK65_MUSDO